MNSDSKSDYTESSYGSSSDSGSFEELCKSRDRNHKKAKKPKSYEEQKKNTCPHCKKYHCRKTHCVEPDKCMWNKKYKGYQFKSICYELEVEFKPRIKFTADLGRYVEKDGLESK
jgi:hypothetical protein